MDELIEHVARAICERPMAMAPGGRPGTWDEMPETSARKRQIRADAKAAIEAVHSWWGKELPLEQAAERQ